MRKATTESTLNAINDIIMEIHWGTLGQMASLLEKAKFKVGKVIEFGKDSWLVTATKQIA